MSEWGTIEPSGALMDTLGTSGPLTLVLVDAGGAATGVAAAGATAEGRPLRAPGGT